MSKCSEFNSENPVVRELDLVAALKVFFNMRAMIRIEETSRAMMIKVMSRCKYSRMLGAPTSIIISVDFNGKHVGPDEVDGQRRKFHGV